MLNYALNKGVGADVIYTIRCRRIIRGLHDIEEAAQED
jgi:hypothetical protein